MRSFEVFDRQEVAERDAPSAQRTVYVGLVRWAAPSDGRVVAHAVVVVEARQVQQPVGPAGVQSVETGERLEVACVRLRTSRSRCRAQVLRQPVARIEPEVGDARVEALVEAPHGVDHPDAVGRRLPRAARQQAMVQSTRRPGGSRSVRFARISGADAPVLNARRPFNSMSPELSCS